MNRFYYRFDAYTAVEWEAWTVLTGPSDTVSASKLRRLRDMRDDAHRLTAHHLHARAFSRGRPVVTDQVSPWPVIDQAELLCRVYRDVAAVDRRRTISPPGAVDAARSCSEQERAWLCQLGVTLAARELSAAALALACAEWQRRRAEWFDTAEDRTRGDCRTALSGGGPS